MYWPFMGMGIYTTFVATADANHDAKRAAFALALALLLILILGAPSNHAGRNSTGIWGVNRQGCRFSRPAPWMARGGGPPNHWRITGTPSPSEVPSGGARAFLVTFGWAGIPGSFPKVTRCKSGTLSGRDRSNGYVPNPTPEEPHITDSERCTHWPLPGSQLPSSRADAGSLAGPARSNW